jgi:DNA-binding LytR/AlgR family response regulator
MKIRTVVVDDEKPARERIKRFLGEHPEFEVVGEAGDGESAVRTIEELRPDLVFLDVRMPEADGFEVLRRLKFMPRVVFATAYERYAVQAFEVHSIDYLLKPFDRKRFGAALNRVREEIRRSVPAEEKLDALLREIRESALALRAPAPVPSAPVRSGQPPASVPGAPRSDDDEEDDDDRAEAPAAVSPAGSSRPSSDLIPGRRGPKIYLLAPAEIVWFEADGELVFARSGGHRYLVSRTLTELEASLDPKIFFRSHRSFIVNLSAIAEIVPEESGNYRIIVRDPERSAIPLSRRQARKLREVFPW